MANAHVPSIEDLDKITRLSDLQSSEVMRSHLLAECQSMNDIQVPVKLSARIKYTSIAICGKYIAMGATTGCIYIFQRSNLKHIQLIPNEAKECGSVTQMSFAPHAQTILGYGTSKGYVAVVELHNETRNKPDKLRSTTDHKDATITCLCWNPEANKLYIGDDKGMVTFTNVTTSKTKGLFILPSELVMRLDTQIVQIDTCEDKLLVSAYNKTYLGNTTRQEFQSIGQRPRDGRYGACFYHLSGVALPVIYCARPGSRMWEVDHDGNVLNTHQFKQPLAVPPLPVVSTLNPTPEYRWSTDDVAPQSVAFPYLTILCDKYIVTASGKGLYIFNPAEAKVVLWTDEITDVVSWVCWKNDVYILLGDGGVRKFSFYTVHKLVSHVYSLGHWMLASEIIAEFHDSLLHVSPTKYVSAELVMDVMGKVEENTNPEVLHKLEDYLVKLKECIEKHSNPAEESATNGEASASGFFRNKQGIYVKAQRGMSASSDELADPSDALLERVLSCNGEMRSEDRKSQDSVSIGSMESEGLKTATVADQAKSTLLSLKDKLKSTFTKTPISEEGDLGHKVSAPSESAICDTCIVPNRREEYSVTMERSDDCSGQSDISKQSSPGSLTLDSKSHDSANPEEKLATRHTREPDAADREPSSDSLSMSSCELMFGSATQGSPDPEPVYAKSFGPIRAKSKKKRANAVDLGGGGVPQKTKGRIRRSESMQHRTKQDVLGNRSVSFPGVITGDATTETIQSVAGSSEQLNKTTPSGLGDMTSSVGSANTVDPVSVTQPDTYISSSPHSSSLNSSLETETSGSVSVMSESPLQSGEDNHASPKSTLVSVRDKISAKMQTTAKSLMETIKETGSKLTGKGTDECTSGAPTSCAPPDTYTDNKDIVNKGGTYPATSEDVAISTDYFSEFSDLVTASELAMDKLQVGESLYSPVACRSILVDWVNHLHVLTRALHKAMVVQTINDALWNSHNNRTLSNSCANQSDCDREDGLCLGEQNNNVQHLEDTSKVVVVSNAPVGELTDDNENDPELETGDICPSSSPDPAEVSIGDDDTIAHHIESGTIPAPDFSTSVYTQLPFKVPTRYSQCVEKLGELATLCFEFGVHGNLTHYLDPFPGCARQRSLKQNPHEEAVNDVDELSSFLMCYFYCVDHERVRQAILWSQESRWKLWKVYLELSIVVATREDTIQEMFTRNALDAIFDRLRSNVLCDKRSFVAVLQSLYRLKPKATMEFCAETTVQKYINPIETIYIIKNEPDFADRIVYFLQVYCEARQPGKSDPVVQLCADTEVCMTVLETLLHSGAPFRSVMCSCGFPRPFAHIGVWNNEDLIHKLVNLQQSKTKCPHLVEKLLLAHGFWRGYLQLVSSEVLQRSNYVKIVLQLNDINLFSENTEIGYFPQSADDWLEVLKLKADQSTLNPVTEDTAASQACLKCGCELDAVQPSEPHPADQGTSDHTPPLQSDSINTENERCITWEFLARKLVNHLGAGRGLKLLQDVTIPHGALPFAFYQAALSNKAIEQHQQLLVHNMVERLDTYLWSRRSAVVPPKVLMAAGAEKRNIDHRESTDIKLDKMFSDLKSEGATITPEEPETHWGVRTQIDRPCPVCGMKLCHSAVPLQMGLVVFPCGHGFHRVCCDSGRCLVCD